MFSRDGVELKQIKDGVFLLTLSRGDNVINPESTAAIADALSVIERKEHPKSLVITGSGKFFSNGLDVKFMMQNKNKTAAMIEGFYRVLHRVLIMDCPTVAAINGHAYGAGLFLALACDHRIMNSEKGFLNFPELNLGMRLSKPFAELAKCKLSPAILRQGILLGARWTAAQALQLGIIDQACPSETLLSVATATALSVLPASLKLANFNALSFSTMKVELYTDAARALRDGTLEADAYSRL